MKFGYSKLALCKGDSVKNRRLRRNENPEEKINKQKKIKNSTCKKLGS